MALGLGLGLSKPYFAGGESFLLDTYTGAAAAYSLRQLSTSTTNVVRVRRSSDDSEQDFTASEITDGTLTTFTGAGDGFVVTWYDQSGNGVNVTAPLDANEPQIVSSGSLILESGKPALLFDGLNNYLEAVVSLDVSSAASAFSVVAGWTDGAILALTSNDTTDDEFLVWAAAGTSRARYNLTPGPGTAIANTSIRQLFTAIGVRNANVTVYRNGSLGNATATATTAPATAIRLRIGARDSTSLVSNARKQEVILYASDKSADRIEIENNINLGW